MKGENKRDIRVLNGMKAIIWGKNQNTGVNFTFIFFYPNVVGTKYYI